MVVSLPSMARTENSFTASPTLSRFQAVPSAPDWRIWNISSADRPSLANWTEYSLMVSISSPEKSRPFWAPAAIRSKAFSAETPKFLRMASAARVDSATS